MKQVLRSVFLVAPLLGACGVAYDSGSAVPAVTPPVSGVVTGPELNDPFFFYERPAEYEVFTTSVEVPVRGDTYVYCDLLRPALNGEPVPGRFPGIISEFNAYAATNSPPTFFAQRGYNVMACDAPGSGNSPGTVHQFDMASTEANYDVIEWFGTQEWSDGNIGQQGSSYGGHTTNLVARLQPPHLKAIIPNSALHDWYENTIYHGGIRNLAIFYQPAFVGATSSSSGGLAGNSEETFVDYGNHPLYDDYWRERSVMPFWDNYTIPALVTDGWNDRYKDGTTKNYMARKQNVWLLMGPWAHSSYSGGALGTITATAHQLAWYDHWLKQLPSAALPLAKVTTFEMPNIDGVTTGWKQYTDWPPPASQVVRRYFTEGRALESAPSSSTDTLSWTVNANDAGADPASSTSTPADQTEADASDYRLIFTSAPLAEDLVLAGATEVLVPASFDATDGNVIARLMDVAEDDTVSQVATGWMKASHYKGHDHLETITPGEFYDIPVHIWPNHWRFKAGHRVRISFSSGDVPDAAPDAPAGSVTVRFGDNARVDFQVLSGALP